MFKLSLAPNTNMLKRISLSFRHKQNWFHTLVAEMLTTDTWWLFSLPVGSQTWRCTHVAFWTLTSCLCAALSAMIRGADDGELFVVRDYTEEEAENVLEQFFSNLKWTLWIWGWRPSRLLGTNKTLQNKVFLCLMFRCENNEYIYYQLLNGKHQDKRMLIYIFYLFKSKTKVKR